MTRKSSIAKPRTESAKRKVLECLAESGNISYACKRAGISRETYYKWRESRVFAHQAENAIEHGKCFVNDLAHTQLIHNIQQGNMQAVRFQLVSCHPDYYQPRRPQKHEEDILHPVTEITIAAPKQLEPPTEPLKSSPDA